MSRQRETPLLAYCRKVTAELLQTD